MLPSGLQHSCYLFISLQIPPQISSLSTWLQRSKWDRVGSVAFVLLGKHSHHNFFEEMSVLWLTVFRFFPCICLIAASSGCCSREQRLAAVRVSLQEPSKTLEHLPQLQEVTGQFSPAHCQEQARGSLHGVAPRRCAHGCSHRCVVQAFCSQAWAEWSAFSSTSGFLAGPDMKHHSSSSQVSQIYLIYKLREDLTLLHATEHQNTFPILIDSSTLSLIWTVLFAVIFFLTFLSIIVWLHMVNENCCMQRVLFCYQLISGSLAGFWNKPEVVAVISFLLENFPFPQGSVQGNILVCSHKSTM